MLTRRVVGRLCTAPRLARYTPRPIRSLASLAQGPSGNDLFANGTNAYYADEMYRLWKEDPKSVHPSWNVYFSGLEKAQGSSKPAGVSTTALHPSPKSSRWLSSITCWTRRGARCPFESKIRNPHFLYFLLTIHTL